ncbi:MAG TPA: FAD-dependent monooxygenase [Phototrophicaceae bacterium]|nr:FAD-dependent monooxygenase [Phototrophicaceae bacterium]
MTERNHAVVIGGSITGLWTARVLADHFEQVTVVDRDHFPATPEARRGVPQGKQLHVLLMRGQQILDQLFPGITQEMAADGVEMIHWTQETHSYGVNGKWNIPFPFGYDTMATSRLLLEWHMRQRLLQNPRIQFVEGRVVTGLLTDEAKTHVIGVRVEGVGAERASVGEETIKADLVVDASGRESHAPDWLKALGYDAPEETVIDAHVGYSTRWYQRTDHSNNPWKSILVQDRTGNVSHSGLVYPIEKDEFIALMVGVNAEIPAEEGEFLDFARQLPVPDIYDAIKDATPITPIYRYQRTANQMRRYGALQRMPESFVLVGDAVCAFNPVFGQGMTVGAMEALLLDAELRKGYADGFAMRFQKQVSKLIAAPWQLATSEDARNLKEGETVDLPTRMLKFYMDHLLSMVGTDPQVGRAFFDVMHLLKPPTTLFAPAVAIKVARSMLTVREPLKPQSAPQKQPVAQS